MRRLIWALALLLVAASCGPSPSASPVGPAGASPSATAEPVASFSPSPAEPTTLEVRLTSSRHNPPALTLGVEITSDGQVVNSLGPPSPRETPGDPWSTRALTAGGRDQVAQEVLDAPLLRTSGEYAAEAVNPLQVPAGLTASIWNFTLGGGPDPIIVTSSAWLGDEAEAAYFVPSPERKELDRLANLLLTISDWVPADGWESADWAPYVGLSYLLWVTVWPDQAPDGLPSVAGSTWPFNGPLESFGDVISTDVSEGRCGYLEPSPATDLAATLAAVAVDARRPVDVATDTGWVRLYLSPRTVDGFPTCADAAPFLPPYSN